MIGYSETLEQPLAALDKRARYHKLNIDPFKLNLLLDFLSKSGLKQGRICLVRVSNDKFDDFTNFALSKNCKK